MNKIDDILKKEQLSHDDLVYMLSIDNEEELKKLFKRAYEIKLAHTGAMVYFRGIIEFSNICAKNCNYCGIRKGNTNVNRFSMTIDEIIEEAQFAYDEGYGSVVMQSGERMDEKFVSFVEEALKGIKKIGNGDLGITISLGEQSYETYKRWFDAGAHRYLLRIETTNEDLYKQLHPPDHDFNLRYKCLNMLREIGYQVGTGVMIGLPGQTLDDLANDIQFFIDEDIDMIGMGPYIPHKDTPMADSLGKFEDIRERQLDLGLKMIATTRIALKDVNMASTTALQALDDIGRELGLLAGANIIMPNVTDTKYRTGYQLYDNKPCLDENSALCKDCLASRIEKIGETIGFGKWGDSPHFKKRIEKN